MIHDETHRYSTLESTLVGSNTRFVSVQASCQVAKLLFLVGPVGYYLVLAGSRNQRERERERQDLRQ